MLKPWLTNRIMASVKKIISSIDNSSARHDEEKAILYNQFKTSINSLKLTKEIIIRNIFMNTKRILFKPGTESIYYKHK